MSFFQSCLNEVSDQLWISAMAIDDDDLIKAIPGNFFTGTFQKVPNYSFIQRKCSRLMFGFIDLTIKIIREYHGIFLFGGAGGPFTHLYKVRADGYMGAMFFKYSNRENTNFTRLLQRFGPF